MRLYAAFRHFGELRGTYDLPPPKKEGGCHPEAEKIVEFNVRLKSET
jgi:hypothetical protein